LGFDRRRTGHMMTCYGWHFLPDDGCLAAYDRYGERVPGTIRVTQGQTLRLDGEPVCCRRGFHGSLRALDALQYAPDASGALVEYVRYSGHLDYRADKFSATERTCLYGPADASQVLREFAMDWFEKMFWGRLLARGREPDPQSVRAIEVARRYMRGEATTEEVAGAARLAVRAAANVADCDAAWTAYAVANVAVCDAADVGCHALEAVGRAAWATHDVTFAIIRDVPNIANADLEARLRRLLGMSEDGASDE